MEEDIQETRALSSPALSTPALSTPATSTPALLTTALTTRTFQTPPTIGSIQSAWPPNGRTPKPQFARNHIPQPPASPKMTLPQNKLPIICRSNTRAWHVRLTEDREFAVPTPEHGTFCFLEFASYAGSCSGCHTVSNAIDYISNK